MRQFFLILTASLAWTFAHGQKDSINIFIPKDDGSPFEWATKHLWVGIGTQFVTEYTRRTEDIKLWTDNGTIDSCNYDFKGNCITPERPGKAIIYSTLRIYTGERWDTVSVKTVFTAITPPDIKILITKDNFLKDSSIQFQLVDNNTNKPLPQRYQVGRMYEPRIFNLQDSVIGKATLCFGTKINKDNFYGISTRKPKIESGYKMKLFVLVRDMETDLLIFFYIKISLYHLQNFPSLITIWV